MVWAMEFALRCTCWSLRHAERTACTDESTRMLQIDKSILIRSICVAVQGAGGLRFIQLQPRPWVDSMTKSIVSVVAAY